MLIYSPEWIAHFNDKHIHSPIYSIAHHPSKQILATAAQDYSIKLWSTTNITDTHTSPTHSNTNNNLIDSHSHQPLQTLSSHTGTIKTHERRRTMHQMEQRRLTSCQCLRRHENSHLARIYRF